MDTERVKFHLQEVLERQRVPDLAGLNYRTAHERFAYVTVRDTLINLGVPLVTAERLADTHKGAPGKRLISCVEHLR